MDERKKLFPVFVLVGVLLVSATSVQAISVIDLSPKITTNERSGDKETHVRQQVEAVKEKSKELSAAADCDADYCTNLGQSLSLTFTCTVQPNPSATCENIFIGLPPGMVVQSSTVGNPGIASVVWSNPGPPGKYSFKTQAVPRFCPQGDTCNASPLVTVTIRVLGPDSQNPEDRLPDPSACAVTISPECLAAQKRCVELLGEARFAECQDRYPFGSQFEVEIPAFVNPKDCDDSFSEACAAAARQCQLFGGSDEFCNKTYPFGSDTDDFLKSRPPGACDDEGLFTATCDQFRRECQLFGLPDNFCETNYPFPTSDESVLVRVDPSGDACDDPTSDTCHRAQRACKALADEAFCQRSFPAR